MSERLRGLLEPRSVAVVGASPKPGSVAGTILKNLQDCGHRGSLHPVNPKYTEVPGLPCVPEIGGLLRTSIWRFSRSTGTSSWARSRNAAGRGSSTAPTA